MALPIDSFAETGSFLMGIQGGYNYMLANRMVLGVEADVSFPAFRDINGLSIGGLTNFSSPVLGAASYGETVLSMGTLRGRIGYAPGNWLFYVTGGLAWTYDKFSLTQVATGTSDSPLLWRFGWTAGAGVELPVAPNWTAKGEYLWTGYPNATTSYPDLGQRIASNLNLQEFRLGLNYHFNGDAPVSNTAASLTPYGDMISLHGQATFTEQAYPSFRSPYSGVNSLDGTAQGRETIDATLYAGLKLWQGAELWFNPAIDQGLGFDDTPGQAGLHVALCTGSARLYPADDQSWRQCREIRRRRQPVRGHAQRGPAGADVRPVWRQRYLRYQQVRQQSEDRFPQLDGDQCRHFRLCRRWLGLQLRRRRRVVCGTLDAARRGLRPVDNACGGRQPTERRTRSELPEFPDGRRNRGTSRAVGAAGQDQGHGVSQSRRCWNLCRRHRAGCGDRPARRHQCRSRLHQPARRQRQPGTRNHRYAGRVCARRLGRRQCRAVGLHRRRPDRLGGYLAQRQGVGPARRYHRRHGHPQRHFRRTRRVPQFRRSGHSDRRRPVDQLQHGEDLRDLLQLRADGFVAAYL